MEHRAELPINGGCPRCGSLNIEVPEDYNDDTIVTCPDCGFKGRWADVFGDRDSIPPPELPKGAA
jgi:hypothetical protein